VPKLAAVAYFLMVSLWCWRVNWCEKIAVKCYQLSSAQ